MKTNIKFALAALTTVLIAAGNALADGQGWYTIDNHHGSVLYLPLPTSETQRQTTVGFFHNGMGIGHRNHSVNRSETRSGQAFHHVTTSQGPVGYFAPAE
ncbi:MAG TPA: hypothetical protein VGM54_19810 [Chthoniobacter sp.]|jgi:hypothetical protein